MSDLKSEFKLLQLLPEPHKILYDVDINPKYPKIAYTRNFDKLDLDKWFYTNKRIPYQLNEYGYRSDKLSSIDDSDYILTFGCSYSYGTGLFYEDTYSYKLANKLNLKNINLAIPGGGISEMVYNTILFDNNFTNIRLPKYVVYQYPSDYRVTLGKEYSNLDSIQLKTIGVSRNEYTEIDYINDYYIKNSGEKKIKDLLFPLYLNNIWESLGVPVFHITFDDYIQELKSDYQTFDILNIKDDCTSLYDKARDLSHNGIKFHDKVKEIILNKIKNG